MTMDASETMNALENYWEEMQNLDNRAEELSSRDRCRLFEIGLDLVGLLSPYERVEIGRNSNIFTELMELVFCNISKLTPLQILRTQILTSSNEQKILVCRDWLSKNEPAQKYSSLASSSNIWRVRAMAAFQNLVNILYILWIISEFALCHFELMGNKELTKIQQDLVPVEKICSDFQLIEFEHFNTDKMKVVYKHISYVKPMQPSYTGGVILVPDSGRDGLVPTEIPSCHPELLIYFNTFDAATEIQLEAYIAECMNHILQYGSLNCVPSVSSPLVKACQLLHNIHYHNLLKCPDIAGILGYVSNIKWILHEMCEYISEVPEVKYFDKYMNFLELALHLENSDALSVIDEIELQIEKPQTFDEQIWITTDLGNEISSNYKDKWQERLENITSSKDAIEKSSQTNCPICIEELASKPEIVIVLNCRHVHCSKCHLVQFYIMGNLECSCCSTIIDDFLFGSKIEAAKTSLEQ